MNIINIFRIEGIPKSEDSDAIELRLADKALSISNIHFRDNDSGEYHLIRVTGVPDVFEGATITKLDPKNFEDKQKMDYILETLYSMVNPGDNDNPL